MRMLRRLVWVTAATACAVAAAVPAAAAGGPPFPRMGAQSSPPGANVWSCHPSAAHPEPVVLVHGLGADMSENWAYISPLLAAQGYCVFALTYGVDPRATIPPFDQMGGVVPMEQSSQQLATFVNQVLTSTGASKVDIVGHSEGSLMPDWYARFLGGGASIDRYVGITPLWHGTDVLGLATMEQYGRGPGLSPPIVAGVAEVCGSCPEFLAGSPFIEKLNSGSGPVVPGVTYTNLMTRYDEAVVPYTSGQLNAPGVTNVVVQDQCPDDLSEHGAMAYDPVVAQDVLNALDPAHASPVRCDQPPPIMG
jgi:triacylglycerol esterase/lipase EstA (alpha/beta hydrolase family)